VPHAPDWFLGLTDVRGSSVPMVDLRVRLGMAPVAVTLKTRILVVDVIGAEDTSFALGLVVDRVLDVATFGADAVEGSPELGGRWRSQQIEAILRRGAGFVALLNPVRLFGAEELETGLTLAAAA
jgi:purine-binding chemotaxis protein CheW